MNIKIAKKQIFFTTLFALVFIVAGALLSIGYLNAEKQSQRDILSSPVAYAKELSKNYDEGSHLNSALGVQMALRDIAKKNMKAVVNISTEMIVETKNPYSQFFGDDFFKQFFGNEFSRDNAPMKRKQKSLGSGFIINEKGYLLSNLHVVKNASKIKVKLYGEEKEYDAEVIGIDESTDIALLKIKASKRDFPHVKLGDSSLIEPGDFAIAIGNPYGLNNTMTLGIVSAKGRSDVGINRFQQYIQIDTSINPGNSGGPLFNIYGDVVGINTLIYSTSGGNIGIGFAIPINLAKKIIGDLMEHGKVTRSYLGVYPQDITSDLAKALGVKPFVGTYVTEVVADSPADEAGIENGDIIVSFDGKKVKRASDLYNVVAETEADKEVDVEIIREGEKITLEVRLKVRPEDEELAKAEEKEMSDPLGLSVANITTSVKKRFNLMDDEGIVVLGTKPSTPSSIAGFETGDVIKSVNGFSIKSVSDYEEYLKKHDDEKTFVFLVKRKRFVLPIRVDLE